MVWRGENAPQVGDIGVRCVDLRATGDVLANAGIMRPHEVGRDHRLNRDARKTPRRFGDDEPAVPWRVRWLDDDDPVRLAHEKYVPYRRDEDHAIGDHVCRVERE